MSIEKLSKLVKVLEKEGRVSPTRLANEVGSDRRTIKKVLKVASDLGITSCENLEIGGRKYSACSLTHDYRKIMQNKAEADRMGESYSE